MLHEKDSQPKLLCTNDLKSNKMPFYFGWKIGDLSWCFRFGLKGSQWCRYIDWWPNDRLTEIFTILKSLFQFLWECRSLTSSVIRTTVLGCRSQNVLVSICHLSLKIYLDFSIYILLNTNRFVDEVFMYSSVVAIELGAFFKKNKVYWYMVSIVLLCNVPM